MRKVAARLPEEVEELESLDEDNTVVEGGEEMDEASLDATLEDATA